MRQRLQAAGAEHPCRPAFIAGSPSARGCDFLSLRVGAGPEAGHRRNVRAGCLHEKGRRSDGGPVRNGGGHQPRGLGYRQGISENRLVARDV